MADNLVLGRGKLFFAPYAFNETTGGVKGYFGNTPMLTMTQATTKLDHYSSEGGLKIKDRSIILQNDMTLAFDTDNISPGNLALWFGGDGTDTLPPDAPSGLGAISVIGKGSMIFGAMTFESDNPIGSNLNYWFPYVSLMPTGTFALKGDVWQVMSFTAEALKRDSATQRVYTYVPAGGNSTAASDTTAEFTVATGSVETDAIATGGTVTATTPQVHLIAFNAAYTLTGGTLAWVLLHDGTNPIQSTAVEVTGASGNASMSAPIAGTYTAKLYGSPDGSTTALGTSASITVS